MSFSRTARREKSRSDFYHRRANVRKVTQDISLKMILCTPSCDWLTLTFQTSESPVGSTKITHDMETGEVDYSLSVGRPFLGSFSKHVWVHCTGSEMTISGNPIKHFTGQNFYGLSDVEHMALSFIEYAYKLIGREIPDIVRLAMETRSIQIKRLDLCDMVKLPNDAIARQALYAIGETATQERRGRASTADTTVMFSPKSKHSKTKLYLKSTEMFVKGHELECDKFLSECIQLDMPGVIRRENELYGRFLKRHNCDLLRDWTSEKSRELHTMLLEKIQIPENQSIDMDLMSENIERKHRLTLEAWKAGRDLREVLSRPTFFRHRKEIFDLYAVDISQRPDVKSEVSNVVPLKEVIQVRPFEQRPEITQYLRDLVRKQVG